MKPTKKQIEMSKRLSPVCIDCGGDVILIEGSTLETIGYGYGTFECLKCGKESSYYGEGLKVIEEGK